MNNPRLAGRYAKSLLDLSVEQGKLEEVYADMKYFLSVNKSNPDFVAILRSPVITSDKKVKIIESIASGHVSQITFLFIKLLVQKKRESNFPGIVRAFIEQYNKVKNIHKVKITTAVPVSNELHQEIVKKVITDTNYHNIELETVVEDALIGGFKLETEGLLVDASILRDLNDVKKQFADNEYIHKIR